MKIYQLGILAIMGAFIWGCKSSDSDPAKGSLDKAVFDSFYQEGLGEAQLVSEIFKDPTPGREIVVRGEIIGRLKPFSDDRALLTLGDPTQITPCNRIPGDLCATPWDCCCDLPETLKVSTSTIQFMDADGGIIKQGLKGYKGIAELSFLTVKGTIAEGSNAENLLINAEAFFVTDPSPFKVDVPDPNYTESWDGGTVSEQDGVFIYTKDPEPEAKSE